MLKKLFIIILLIVPMVISAYKKTAVTFTATYNGVDFTAKIVSTDEKTIEIIYDKKNKYKMAELSIPQTLDYVGVPFTVISIGEKAFANNDNITKVYLPNTLKFIKNGAFSNCTSLEDCKFPEGLKEIGDFAFQNCYFSSFIFPESLEKIGKESFTRQMPLSQANSAAVLTQVYLPNGILDIGENAFIQILGSGIAKAKIPTYCILASIPPSLNTRKLTKVGLHHTPTGVLPQNVFGGGGMFSHPQATPQQQVSQQPVIADNKNIGKTNQSLQIISDVDKDIPEISSSNDKTFAVIICNEDYQTVATVPFAKKDGKTFQTYCENTLGIPAKNIHIRENATLNNMRSELAWIKQVCDAYQGEASVIFYYAGHGIPNEATHDSYLLPVDGDGAIAESGYKLSEVYKVLSEMQTKLTLVFMDACFSGSQRGNGMLASARGVAIKAKTEQPKGSMVVFSAASGDETAFPYDEKGHGMFTYFLLKSLKESKGGCTLGELSDYIVNNVRQQSIVINSKSQTPTVFASEGVNDWKNIKIK